MSKSSKNWGQNNQSNPVLRVETVTQSSFRIVQSIYFNFVGCSLCCTLFCKGCARVKNLWSKLPFLCVSPRDGAISRIPNSDVIRYFGLIWRMQRNEKTKNKNQRRDGPKRINSTTLSKEISGIRSPRTYSLKSKLDSKIITSSM